MESINTNSNNTNSSKETMDAKEALNEYFKLKTKYETQIMVNKKKIMNNQTLSNREKRVEYLKLKPKCINCNRPGGTRFQTTFFDATDKEEAHRQHSAICGVIGFPCDLNIKIQIGSVELLPDILNSMEKDIRDTKNEIIDNKNKLLFGYLTAEQVLSEYDSLKDAINVFTSLYENYLERYNRLVDNDETNAEINESITSSYIQINSIKDCIKKMNETSNAQYARDAVHIYVNILEPLMKKIRTLKYNETSVWHDTDLNVCKLIQKAYSIQNLSYSSFQDKVVEYNVAFNAPKPTSEITWHLPEYAAIWNKLPPKLKNALSPYNEWAIDFVSACVNAKSKKQYCTFVPPRNLKLPPEKLADGKYDFGVQVYSDEFNKLPKSLQDNYLTLHSTKDGYKLLIDAMNDLVEKGVGYTANQQKWTYLV